MKWDVQTIEVTGQHGAIYLTHLMF